MERRAASSNGIAGNGASPQQQPIAGGGGPPPGMMPPGDMPPGLTLPTRRKIVIMLSVMVALFLAALDMTIWVVAAPQAVGDLGRLDLLAWPQTAYLLGSTVLVPIIGKLSDLYGRKPFLITGILIFIVGSLLSGMAGSMWELIGFRLVQGCGAAFIMANAFTVMGDYFAPAERPRWAGIVAGVFALSNIIGPLVGGVLTDELSWRWVFYINIPIGGLALLLTIIVVPWYRGQQREPIDWTGATLLIAAGTPLLLAFSLGGTQVGWADSPVVACFIAAFAATALFIWVGRRKGRAGDHAAADVPQPHLHAGDDRDVCGGDRDDGDDVCAALLPAGRAGHLGDQLGAGDDADEHRDRDRLDRLRADHGAHGEL